MANSNVRHRKPGQVVSISRMSNRSALLKALYGKVRASEIVKAIGQDQFGTAMTFLFLVALALLFIFRSHL